MLSYSQLVSIFKLQDSMNTKIKDGWLNAGYPYLRGTFVECAEAIDPAYKWWKSGEEDIDNVRVELIDMLHFNASHVIRDFNGDCEAAAQSVVDILNQKSVEGDLDSSKFVLFDNVEYEIESLDSLMKIELMAGLAVSRRISWPLFFASCKDYGMDTGLIFKTYIGKNILNSFRQDMGYKEGTYLKHSWDHNGKMVEDNVILHNHIESMDIESPTFSEDLYDAMKASYPG